MTSINKPIIWHCSGRRVDYRTLNLRCGNHFYTRQPPSIWSACKRSFLIFKQAALKANAAYTQFDDWIHILRIQKAFQMKIQDTMVHAAVS